MHALKRLGLHGLLWLICVNLVVLWSQARWNDPMATGMVMVPVLCMFMGYMMGLGVEACLYVCCKDKVHRE